MADHRVLDLTAEEVSKGMSEGRYLLVDVREPNAVSYTHLTLPTILRV